MPVIFSTTTAAARGKLRFRHHLVRSAIYQSASAAQRRSAHLALAKLFADEPDRSVWHRAPVAAGPAYEAALLAGVASKVFDDVEAANASVRMRESVTEPDPARAARYDELHSVFASLYPALRGAMHVLARW